MGGFALWGDVDVVTCPRCETDHPSRVAVCDGCGFDFEAVTQR